jgi:hypothetical protein
MEGNRAIFSISICKPEEKRHFGNFRHRWEYKIKMDLKEISVNFRNWMDSAQDRQNPCEREIDPLSFINN